MFADPADELAWIWVVALVAASVVGLAAIWSARFRVRWIWHVAPLAILLAAAVRLGGFEPIVLFGAQAGLVVGTLVAIRLSEQGYLAWQRRRGSADPIPGPARARWRFHLLDLGLAVSLAAIVLAIVVPGLGQSAPPGNIRLSRWLISGLGFGCATMAAVCLAIDRERWYVRSVPAVMFLVLASFLVARSDVREAFAAFSSSTPQPMEARGWAIALPCAIAASSAAYLAIMRLAGWVWWRRELAAPTTGNSRSSLRKLARAAACAAPLAAFVLLVPAYWAALPPACPEQVFPVPNAYDDFQRAAKLLNWNAVPGQDVYEASDQACMALATDNETALRILHEGFTKESCIPLDYTNGMSTHSDAIQSRRSLARFLLGVQRAELAGGDRRRAVEACLDRIRLGRKLARGGLVVDEVLADSFAAGGRANLVELLGNLDGDELEVVRKALEPLCDAHEPVDKVVARDRLFWRLAGGWRGRLVDWIEFSEHGAAAYGLRTLTRAQTEALLRLTMTEAAVRRYQLLQGRPPGSLAALVPEYLAAVPADPFGEGPLVYRRTDAGYLLYCVGGNGVDDGGQRAALDDVLNGRGDLFFDTKE